MRDEIKRLKMLDLERANEALTPEGETADRGAVKLARAEARAERGREKAVAGVPLSVSA